MDASDVERAVSRAKGIKYADGRLLTQREVTVAYRSGAVEVSEGEHAVAAFRAVGPGYGVASTYNVEAAKADIVLATAIKAARESPLKAELTPVRPEVGRVAVEPGGGFDEGEAVEFLKAVVERVEDEAPGAHVETVLTYCETDSFFASSEGARLRERRPFVDLVTYVVARTHHGVGYASKVVGSQGGLRELERVDLDELARELARRAFDSSRAVRLSPLHSGRRFAVVLDEECAGGVAHEVAHMLEAGSPGKRLLSGLKLYEFFAIVDSPLLPGAYGSYEWDDEGVRGVRRELLSREGVELLHTRLTAARGGRPGSAKGVTTVPRPMMSNVFVAPGDWRKDEILEETREGFRFEGLVKAEVDSSTGEVYVEPELAYYFDRSGREVPVRAIAIRDYLKRLLENIDAVGRIVKLRPNLERSFRVSEGGPYLRVAAARIAS